MVEYALYVKSGPKQRKTQVHVIDLLGCTVNGDTTAAALAVIRDYLAFLKLELVCSSTKVRESLVL